MIQMYYSKHSLTVQAHKQSSAQNTFFAAAQSTSTGSTVTGNSTSALDATVKTAAAAFRIVSHVSDPSDAYPDVLVKFNPGAHQMTNNVGL